MGRINRNNYEIFFLDYLEGNLDESVLPELKEFIANNPDLEEELSSLNTARLTPDKTSFNDKDRLRKNPVLPENISNFEELCIACLENDLTPKQKKEFKKFIQHSPRHRKEFETYQKTRLTTEKISFNDKNTLKKGKIYALPGNRISQIALAASVALLAGVFSLFNKSDMNAYTYSNKLSEHIKYSIKEASNQNFILDLSANKPILSYTKTYPIGFYDSSPNVLVKSKSVSSTIPEGKILKKIQSKSRRIAEQSGNEKIFTQITPGKIPYSSFPAIKARADRDKNFLAEKVDQLKNKINPEKKSFSLLNLADAGLEGISKITGKTLDLKPQYNSQGELKRLAFTTETFRFSTQVKNKDQSDKK